MARLAVVDDHVLIRQSVSLQLRAAGHDVVVDTASFSEVCDRRDIDLVVLDLDLGSRGPADDKLVAELTTRGVAVVVLSALASARQVRRMVAAGVAAVVSKSDDLSDLQGAVTAALAGHRWTTPLIARALLDERGVARPALSPQELDALRLYASGLKLDTVARRMGVAPSTVKQYLDRVRGKYEAVGHRARSRSELFNAATDDGFIVPQRDWPTSR